MNVNRKIEMTINGNNCTIALHCPCGTFHADLETTEETPHNAIYLRFTPANKTESVDVACIRDIDNSNDVDVKLWGDVFTEDPTIEVRLLESDLNEALT